MSIEHCIIAYEINTREDMTSPPNHQFLPRKNEQDYEYRLQELEDF